MKVLTEADLRAKRVSETAGGEYHVETGTFVTPMAKEYLQDHKIRLVFGQEASEKNSHPVYGRMTRTPVDKHGKHTYVDGITGEGYEEKPEDMTHLRGNILVPKTHPRIAFRGMLDSLQAQVLLLQEEYKENPGFSKDLESVLSYLRAVLGAEVKGEKLSEISLLGLNHKEIREKSHNVKKEFGMDHPIPHCSMGKKALEINLLRTKVREAELSCAQAFPDGDELNLIEHMNRLSSGIYIIFCRILSGFYEKEKGGQE